MISCPQAFSLTAGSDPCTPDTGPPVPASWSDPQPSSLVITGFNENAFQVVPVCPGGTATAHFNGAFPVRYAPDAFTLKYESAGSSGLIEQPYFIQTDSVLATVLFVPSTSWTLQIICETNVGQKVWVGKKLVGTDPTGTYNWVPNVGSATLPACVHVAQNNIDWTPMVWVPTLNQPNGTASASGNGPNFAVSATANAAVTNFGQILGTMLYTGPIIGSKVAITVTGIDTGGFSSFRVRVNGSTLTVTPAVGFGALGTTYHYFTIFDPANPASPLVGATVEVRAIAQTNIVGNSPAFSGVLT